MATRMQQRRGTASQWSVANPVLAAGEIGVESDTAKFKIGDGVNAWTDLDYFETSESAGGTFIEDTEKGAANGVATLDATANVPADQLANVDFTYAETYVDDRIGDGTVDGTAGNTITDRINTAISNLVAGADVDLDTLKELADAINNDDEFATTINNLIAGKADASHTHPISDITNLQGSLDDKVEKVNGTVTTASTDSTVVRNITLSLNDPTGGNDGDVWMKYE